MTEETEKSKYLPLYYSYIEQLRLLTPEQTGRLILALLEHGRDGSEPDFARDSNLYMAFSFISDNAQRAERRGMALLEKKKAAGRTRAANAQKDEKGRFLPSASSATPAEPSASSTSSYHNDKNKDKDNHNRRLPQARGNRGRDDDAEREKILLACEKAVGKLDAAERGMILTACAGMDADAAEKAVNIAKGYGARSAAYLAKSLQTQREKPERELRAASAGQTEHSMLSARPCPRIPADRNTTEQKGV